MRCYPNIWFIFVIVASLPLCRGSALAEAAKSSGKTKARRDQIVKKAEKSVRSREWEGAAELYMQIAQWDLELASKRLGPIFARLGQHDQALRFYGAIIKRRPKDHWAWYCYAYAARKKGGFSEAEKAYLQVLKLAPGNTDSLYGLGLTYKGMDRPEDALRFFRKYIRSETRKAASGWITRAEREVAALVKQKEPAKSPKEGGEDKARVETSGKAPSHDKTKTEDVPALFIEAKKAEDAGELEKAESLWKKGLAEFPRHKSIHRGYIRFLMTRGRMSEAEVAIRLSLRQVPGFGWARWQLVRLMMKRGEFEKTALHVRILAADHPNNAGGLCARGHYKLKNGETRKADGLFNEGMKIAVENDDKDAWTFCRSGRVKTSSTLGTPAPPEHFKGSSRREAARPADKPKVEKGLEETKPTEHRAGEEKAEGRREKPDSVASEIVNARTKMESGDLSSAEKIAKAYLGKNSRSYHARIVLADVAYKKSDYKRAREEAEKAKNINSKLPAAYRILGLVDLKYRKRSSAKANLEKFMELVSGDKRESKNVGFIEGLLKNLR